MKITMLLLFSIISNITFGQQTKQRKSYPANLDKIENIKSSYSGCTLGPCYSWWSIALKGQEELLIQHGGHYPPGSRSRNLFAGKWKINGDTLRLDIDSKLFHDKYMHKEYLMVREYELEILLPIDGNRIWGDFMKNMKAKFEESKNFKEFTGYPKWVIRKSFGEFVSQEYSADNNILVQELSLEFKK